MKKLSIIMATVASLVCLLCVSASAANEVTVSVNVPESAAAGSEVTVAVDFSENTGFNTLGVKLTYPEGFTYVADSATASELIKSEFYLNFAGYEGETYVFYHDEEARTLTFVGAGLYDIDEASGSLFSAKFTAPETVSESNTFAVEVVDSVYNATGEVVTLTPENGSMNVEAVTYKLGDVNGDKFVNNVDAMILLQSMLGAYNLTDEQKIIGDVNKDSYVNNVDAMLILQAMINGTTIS